jgi:hypothetical protein
MEILALVISIVALGVSIKAYLDSRWIEIDWNFEDSEKP